jgi:hypothetical protein
MARCVRGDFFAEYVRMIRRRKDVAWDRVFPPDDMPYLKQHIEPEEWYPMETFERFGIAILSEIDGAGLDAVRAWGRFSASRYCAEHPNLVASHDPIESLMRLKVMRSTLFNFPAFDIPMLIDHHARVVVTYHMGPTAEEAACHQTLGFCEEVLALSGATEIRGSFQERAWKGDPRTLFSLEWVAPPRLSKVPNR